MPRLPFTSPLLKIELPRIRTPLLNCGRLVSPYTATPALVWKAMTLPSPGLVPPTSTLSGPNWIAMPSSPLPRLSVAVGSVPIQLPWMVVFSVWLPRSIIRMPPAALPPITLPMIEVPSAPKKIVMPCPSRPATSGVTANAGLAMTPM